MKRPLLIAVGIVIAVSVLLVLSRLMRVKPGNGQQVMSSKNGLLCALTCKSGTSREQPMTFECQLRNVSNGELKIRQIVHGLNLHCYYGPPGSKPPNTSEAPVRWRTMHPSGSFSLPPILTLATGEVFAYRFSIKLEHGKYECFATYSVPFSDTNTTWHGIATSESIGCDIR